MSRNWIYFLAGSITSILVAGTVLRLFKTSLVAAKPRQHTEAKPNLYQRFLGEARAPHEIRTDHLKTILYGSAARPALGSGNYGGRNDFELALQLFTMIRSLLANEITLINNRISWQILIQGGLIAAFFQVWINFVNDSVAVYVIVGLGVIYTVFCWLGVRAAYAAANGFKQNLVDYLEIVLPNSQVIPSCTGRRLDSGSGKVVAYAFTILPLFIWAGLSWAFSLRDKSHPSSVTLQIHLTPEQVRSLNGQSLTSGKNHPIKTKSGSSLTIIPHISPKHISPKSAFGQ